MLPSICIFTFYFSSHQGLNTEHFFLLFLCSFIESCNIKCCCSVAKSCATICDPRDCSTSGFPVPHHLLEFAQVHVYWISDTIQPSHSLLPSSPSAFSFSQHQGLFQWVNCLHQVAKELELWLQHLSFHKIIHGWFPLGLTGLILLFKGLSKVFSKNFSNHSWKASVKVDQ